MSVAVPETRYARSGDVTIAYQVVGDHHHDLVFVPLAMNVEYVWHSPVWRTFFDRLSSFSRLILLDKRGTGLSDRSSQPPTLEMMMDDVRAVMDDVGSERAALIGAYQGGQMCALFAATYPERTTALVLYHTLARAVRTPDYAWGDTDDPVEYIREVGDHWGEREYLDSRARSNPSLARDEEWRRFFVSHSRLSLSPGGAAAFFRAIAATDIREVLPAIRVPTLVLHRPFARDAALNLAARIPRASAVEVPGEDSGIYVGAEIPAQIARFLNSLEDERITDRVVATVLFTDLVDSTARAVQLGPRWHEVLREHNAAVRRELARFSGREVDTAGDGFFASGFDGPARAIRCGCAIRDAITALGLGIRVGVHTGECELVDGKLAGVPVVVGARLAAQAEEGEVLVSGTVKDLVAGSGIEFDARGVRELKGLGEWPVYAVAGN